MARKVVAEFDAIDGPFLNKLRAIDRSIGRFESGTLNAFGRVEKGMAGLLSSAAQLRNVTGLIAGGLGASMVTGFLDTSTKIRNALREVGGDSEAAFNQVYLAATRSLAPMDAFAQGVQRMQKVMGDKQTFTESVRQMETLNKLMALGGKSTQERASTMLQFSQALQAGYLGGEELRAIRENAPIELVRAIAREAGGGIEDLKKFGEQGVLTTEVMIRALKSLEQEADARIGKVRLTIEDAATTMRNGAIVASEGFDKGLGLSRAAVSALQGLGQILGSNAEAFEVWGKRAQIAGAFFAATFAGRRISDSTQALSGFSRGLLDSGKAAQDAARKAAVYLAAQEQQVVKSAMVVGGINRQITAMRNNGASTAALDAAYRRLETAQSGAAAAVSRYQVAVNAATAANARLAFSVRATAAAKDMLMGAFAFLGGFPGLILTLGAAFLTLGGNIETAATRFDRLKQDTGSAEAAASSLKDVQVRLNEAIAEAGISSDDAHKKIMANTAAELAAKSALLRLENQRLETIQAERQAEIDRLKAQIDAIPSAEDSLIGVVSKPTALSSIQEQQAYAQLLADAQRVYNEEAQISVDKITELSAVMTLTGIQIDGNNQLLANSGSIMQEAIGGASQYAEALKGMMDGAWDAAKGIASTSISGSIADAAGVAKSLAGWLMNALGSMSSMASARAMVGNMPEIRGPAGMTVEPSLLAPTISIRPRSAPQNIDFGLDTGGGGGSKRKSETDKAQEEALRFIEQMMTAEEKRAKNMKEMTDLRAKLVASYGPEAAIVAQMDQAIQRASAELSNMDTVAKDFFGTLSDEIASSIEDWKGWGSFVRSVLASLVRSWGPDFFTALLMPGAQSGGGAGTFLGNMMTGQLHGGGGAGNRNARSVPASAFINAPRFHNGLASDEFTAILQKGETVLPKGMKLGGGGTTINFSADLRGADPSMKPYIDAKFKQIEREFNGRVVGAIRVANKSRSLG